MNSIAIMAWNRVRHLEERQPNLLELLFETTGGVFDCALPDDRVYALLVMQNEGDRVEVAVDYTLHPGRLFIETAKAIISKTKNLRILSFSGLLYEGPARDTAITPSWAPNWILLQTHGL